MKITGCQTLHCDAGWRNFSFLKLQTDDGLVGISEYNESYGSKGLTAVIEALVDAITGDDPCRHEFVSQKLYAMTRQAHGGLNQQAIVPNAKTETPLPIIKETVEPDSIVYTDTFRAYNALDVSDCQHRRINHSKLFADNQNHINGIVTFWNQAKRHMCKYNGIKSDNFYWFLKECE